ncbi:DUF192 domain-containing protein [Leptospira idonii]|uniref:DUF192 domain-containing protein n=1 Tax=Leptospira idonii TaxID=1193500 RepID=A0A4R9LXY0_9LEPT|nr:DUF192 domain-containing protein [Leptospira idonii]TGN19194.1 DUF192 domain-containing protein [Leptospira idonii]
MLRRVVILFIFGLFYQCSPTDSAPVQTETIFGSIGDRSLKLEVANNPSTRAVGLMHRTRLGEDEGMLFVFPKEEYLSFWMKNTLIPLTLGYFSEDMRLLETHDMTPNQTKEVYNSMKPAKYALEVNLGWFAKNKIGKDAVLLLEKKISARD